MKINRRLVLAILLFVTLFGTLYISTYLYITDSNKKEDPFNISVIVYGSNSDRWATLKQGIDQGAADFGAQVNFVTMTMDNNVDEQRKLLEREILNGADGIIMAATDSYSMKNAVEDAALTLPIVMVETNVEGVEGIPYISADNYSMGLNIGRSVILNCNQEASTNTDIKIALLMENQRRSSVYERYDGFMDSLKYSGFNIELWQREEDEQNLSLFIQDRMKESNVDILVALDDTSLEAVIDAVETNDYMINVYGIGSTNKIIHYLDYGVLNSVVYQNEFNMGYLSIQKFFVKDEEKSNSPLTEIEFRTINRDTMYLPKNQRLVFPIIQ
ncbi:MAG: sugar ABC transporter substrate-binding protein [Clostridiales bacterium]|nr:sugar ABC transporter substrate-binding protein [Clostridiales bacterium]